MIEVIFIVIFFGVMAGVMLWGIYSDEDRWLDDDEDGL